MYLETFLVGGLSLTGRCLSYCYILAWWKGNSSISSSSPKGTGPIIGVPPWWPHPYLTPFQSSQLIMYYESLGLWRVILFCFVKFCSILETCSNAAQGGLKFTMWLKATLKSLVLTLRRWRHVPPWLDFNIWICRIIKSIWSTIASNLSYQ